MSRICCVDMSGICKMQWKALAGRAGKGGDRQQDTAEETISYIAKRREGYDVCVIACDPIVKDKDLGWKAAPSFRIAYDPIRQDPEDPSATLGYKANREHWGAPYYAQLITAAKRLRADGCHVIMAPALPYVMTCPGCKGDGQGPHPEIPCEQCKGDGKIPGEMKLYSEADDVMAWVAEHYRDAAESALGDGEDPGEWALRLVSSDFDIAQLIDPMVGIDLFSPHAGKVYTADDIIARFGVPPAKVAQFKALAGDASDNYQPYRGTMGQSGKRNPGIGPEGAKKLLAIFANDALAAVTACIAEPPTEAINAGITPNMIALIRRGGYEAAERGLRLATLRTDLPGLDFAPILAGPLPVQPITKPSAGPPPDSVEHGQGVQGSGDAFADGREMRWTPGADKAPDAVPFDVMRERMQDAPVARTTAGTQHEANGQKQSGDAADRSGPGATTLAEPGLSHISPGKGPRDAAQADASEGAAVNGPRASTGPSPSPVVARSPGEGAADGIPVARAEVMPRATPAERAQRVAGAITAPGHDQHNDLAPYTLEPKNLDQAWWSAQKIAEARIFARFGTAECVLTIIMMGRSRGAPMMTALENAFLIGDQVGWRSVYIVGCVLSSGLAEYLTIERSNSTEATAVTLRRRGGIGKPQSLTFTIDEAKALGYLDPPKPGKSPGSWHKQPAVMLRWRALVALARLVYPDLVSGMHDPSELRDDGTIMDEEMSR